MEIFAKRGTSDFYGLSGIKRSTFDILRSIMSLSSTSNVMQLHIHPNKQNNKNSSGVGGLRQQGRGS